ncbi:MAG: ribosome biogenesis GTPase YlqF [Clostridiales bacterium]|nr:ribosome biogenesis GTPase YlqF [Clostridiales bacterium]
MPDINWYPGHMAKSRAMLREQLRGVDAVIELCDARAPRASRNPDLDALAQGKARVLVLNKADLADEAATRIWLNHFRDRGLKAIKVNSVGGSARESLAAIRDAAAPKVERMAARGVNKTVRAMVVGIPNVGKSTFINRLFGSAVAKASDRPGVTRARQWVRVGPYLELMDTPGMLWPRLSDQNGALALAFLGSVGEQALDVERVARSLLDVLYAIAPQAAEARFRAGIGGQGDLLERACAGRGWLLSGGRLDEARGAALVLDEFRAGKVGRITLELPDRSFVAVRPAEQEAADSDDE